MSTQTHTATRRGHHDAPDTAADFEELATMPEGPEKQRLQECVVTAWLPMAHRIALKFRNRGESSEDLKQVAALALVKAVERYDPAQGNAFESYAVPTITGELKRHFRDNMWDLHVPRRVQNLRNQVRTSARDLRPAVDGRTPTVEELSAHSGLPEEDVRAGLGALESYKTLSLDAELRGADDSFSLADTLGDEDAGYGHVVDREAVKVHLRHLSDRERRILYLRFFREMTQSAIGEEFGISQMHVSRLISGTCRRIREEIDADLTEEHDEVPAGIAA